MTLDDLREKTKAAYNALVLHRQSIGGGRIGNMQETFAWASILVSRVNANDPDLNVSEPLLRLLRQFHKAGDTYYFAKKHGMTAALIRKLSQ